MSTARGAKLKAQYNRVRTSTALRANDMWTNTIGMEQDPQAGSNAAVEAAIYAPTHGGGGNRTQRRELAQQLIQATGYQPSVTDYQGLLTLAKEQGSLGAGTRGACKLCGGMGHLTKQCTNFLTGHNAASTDVVAAVMGAAGAAPAAGMGLLPDPDDISLSDLGSSDSDSDGGSSSDSDAKRSKKRKRSSKDKKDKEKSSKKSKKEKKEKKSKSSKKSKKSKSKRRKHDSSSDDDK